jgi:hypothetical protein
MFSSVFLRVVLWLCLWRYMVLLCYVSGVGLLFLSAVVSVPSPVALFPFRFVSGGFGEGVDEAF